MGLLIQNKISQIIRQRMDEIQFEEVSLSLISHKELWKLTNRWDQEEIFKLVGDEYLLVPTAEEEITNYVKTILKVIRISHWHYIKLIPNLEMKKDQEVVCYEGKSF